MSAIITVNKVQLKSPKTSLEQIAQTMLLCSSVLYEDIVETGGENIQRSMDMLIESLHMLKYMYQITAEKQEIEQAQPWEVRRKEEDSFLFVFTCPYCKHEMTLPSGSQYPEQCPECNKYTANGDV